MKHRLPLVALAISAMATLSNAAPIELTIDPQATAKPISPYIYGKNHGISQKHGTATKADTMQRYMDAGMGMLRLNNGNNATKYNWELRMSSHPDWYNNVNDASWDQSAVDVENGMPGVQSLYALSLLGWVAGNKDNNFNDWLYNGSQWWWDADANSSGTEHNWAGTTPITAAGQKPTGSHDPNKYLIRQSEEKTLGIFDHFFGTGANQLALDSTNFRYWNMDNEADIWNGTHNDVMPDTMSAEEFVQIYSSMAQKARDKFPGIKLVGPVLTNEWQWYYWHSQMITYDGKEYSMIEYFIKRIAEEQTRTGKKLLDVVDLHFYPDYKDTADYAKIMQLHRIWFDTTYVYPKANGVKWAMGNNVTKEFIFQRIRNWLDQYMGAGHGVTLGITECGAIDGAKDNASVIAVWYASHLGEFGAAGDVEVFTPWTWYPGMFETMHLFTRYGKKQALPPVHSSDHLLSVYPSKNANGDSLTLMIVNRGRTDGQQVKVNLGNFTTAATWAPTYDLAYLKGETFKSKTQNAIYANGATIADGAITLTVPSVSVTAVVIASNDPGTMPVFPDRTNVPSSSSTTPSSSSSASNTKVVWDYTLGAQVNQPSGSAGGWWYSYADPLSTISAVDKDAIAADQSLHMVFDAQQDADQNYNYAGLGFNWVSTAAGATINTVDLSSYSGICVDYKSNAGLIAAIGQRDPAAPTKNKNFESDGAVLPASDTRNTVCLPWSTFPGTGIDLKTQSLFQIQLTEAADFQVYQISLEQGASPVIHQNTTWNSLRISLQRETLALQGAPLSTVSLYNLQGKLLNQWNFHGETRAQISLQNLSQGMHLLRVNGYGDYPILVSPMK